MAVLPDADRNFINGLADFWVSLFQDTSFTQAYLQAGQIQLGQVYLELMNTVLGSSLNHVPLFSKYYYKLFAVREDQVSYEEGASDEEDRYVFSPDHAVVKANTLMNRVVAPTRTLEARRDYAVEEGSLKFYVNPFDATGSLDTVANFPVRSVQVAAAATYTAPTGADWRSLGVKTGDTFRLEYPIGGQRKEARVLAIDESRLMLDGWLPEFSSDLRGKSHSVQVVRIPFDAKKTGVAVPGAPKQVASVTGTPTNATNDVTLTTLPAFTVTTDHFLYIEDRGVPTNSGFYRINSVSGNVLGTNRGTNFVTSAGPFTIAVVDFGSTANQTPRFSFTDALLETGSLSISGRRSVTRTVGGVVYEDGGSVVEGIDYVVDYERGELTYLTPWEPVAVTYCDYLCRLQVCNISFEYRGDFVGSASYAQYESVRYNGKYYYSRKPQAPSSFLVQDWVEYASPFDDDQVFQLREIAFWAPDVLVDKDALYTNYGYLLGYKKPSSEAYRAFLKGVSQLFLLGPTLERFESALNVMAGLPVVRDDGELLEGFDSGYVNVSTLSDATLGNGGQLIDGDYGRAGYLDAGLSQFSTTETKFYGADVGAVLRVKTPNGFDDYAIIAVDASGHLVDVAPAPPASQTVEWTYSHNVLRRHFRVDSNDVTHIFTDADVDSVVVIENASEAKNVGVFRIVSVVGPREVVLDTPFSFVDAAELSWRLSKTKYQTVVTSRTEYALPLLVPVREDLKDPSNYGVLTLSAFEALSTVVTVEDYRDNPTWWHRVSIPQELLSLTEESSGRRNVTPQLIPHVVDALDQAVVDDYGISIGRDDHGDEGIRREGSVTWLGGGWIRLDFATGASTTPGARINDIGQYVSIFEGPFSGFFEIKEISPDGTQVRLDRFPPPPKHAATAPEVIPYAEVPPILFRRTVAFVLLDRFLKYHAMRVRIQTNGGISSDFISEAAHLIQEAKPAHVYAYIEPATSFVDTMSLTDSLLVSWGPYFVDKITLVNTSLSGDTELGANEYHATTAGNHTGTSAGGTTSFTISPSFAYTPDRIRFVFGRFQTGTCSGKIPTEGVNYTFNKSTGQVVVTGMDAGSYNFRYLVVALRSHSYAVNWWTTGASNGETPVAVHGEDPLKGVTPAGLSVGDYGFTDRPVQITIT